MTKTIKYCMYPVEDGRCGKAFTTHSIRTMRRFCDEHAPTVGTRTKGNNTNILIANQEEMRAYVRREIQSSELTRKELNDKLIVNNRDTNKRIDFIRDIVADITNSDLEGYTIKKHQTMKKIIEERIDILSERNIISTSREGKIMDYIVKMNNRIKTLEVDLEKAYEIIESNKAGKKIKRKNKNKNKNEEI